MACDVSLEARGALQTDLDAREFPWGSRDRVRAGWRGDLTPSIRRIRARPANRPLALEVATELLHDRALAVGQPPGDVIDGCFAEGPNVSGEVGPHGRSELAAAA